MNPPWNAIIFGFIACVNGQRLARVDKPEVFEYDYK